MSETANPLKLHALDREGLNVVSAHFQDACVKREDMTYLAQQKRFVVGALRYDWAASKAGVEERVGSVLRFDRVLRVAHLGMQDRKPGEVLNLLGMTFEEIESPSGMVFLAFADGAIVRLDVECLEVDLRDVGPRAPACECVGHALTRADANESL